MILANLGKAKFFTTLDLKLGYHQIYLAECDREKTSFSINGGKYEFCRLPFGIKNAGCIFQRAIDDVLREQIWKICYVYVDDVIIFSENAADHVRHMEFLGFIVTADGAKTDPEKVKTIQEYTEPKNLFSLRSFLGLARYYRSFVKETLL